MPQHPALSPAADTALTHLTLRQTAQRLGIGYSTLKRWIAEERLPEALIFRVPGMVWIRRQALEAYLAEKEMVNGVLPTPSKPETAP